VALHNFDDDLLFSNLKICGFVRILVFLQCLNCKCNEYLSIQCNTETWCRPLYFTTYYGTFCKMYTSK